MESSGATAKLVIASTASPVQWQVRKGSARKGKCISQSSRGKESHEPRSGYESSAFFTTIKNKSKETLKSQKESAGLTIASPVGQPWLVEVAGQVPIFSPAPIKSWCDHNVKSNVYGQCCGGPKRSSLFCSVFHLCVLFCFFKGF